MKIDCFIFIDTLQLLID